MGLWFVVLLSPKAIGAKGAKPGKPLDELVHALKRRDRARVEALVGTVPGLRIYLEDERKLVSERREDYESLKEAFKRAKGGDLAALFGQEMGAELAKAGYKVVKKGASKKSREIFHDTVDFALIGFGHAWREKAGKWRFKFNLTGPDDKTVRRAEIELSDDVRPIKAHRPLKALLKALYGKKLGRVLVTRVKERSYFIQRGEERPYALELDRVVPLDEDDKPIGEFYEVEVEQKLDRDEPDLSRDRITEAIAGQFSGLATSTLSKSQRALGIVKRAATGSNP